jgi:hypothetical protein
VVEELYPRDLTATTGSGDPGRVHLHRKSTEYFDERVPALASNSFQVADVGYSLSFAEPHWVLDRVVSSGCVHKALTYVSMSVGLASLAASFIRGAGSADSFLSSGILGHSIFEGTPGAPLNIPRGRLIAITPGSVAKAIQDPKW